MFFFFFIWSLSTTQRESFGIQEIQSSFKDQVKRPRKCSGELVEAWLLHAAWSVMGLWVDDLYSGTNYSTSFFCLFLKKKLPPVEEVWLAPRPVIL